VRNNQALLFFLGLGFSLCLPASASENLALNGDFEFPASGPNAVGWTVETTGSGVFQDRATGLSDDGTGSVRMSVSQPGDVVRMTSDCIYLPTPTVTGQYLITVRHRDQVGTESGWLRIRGFSDTACQNPAGSSSINAILGTQGQWDLVSRIASGPGSVTLELNLGTNDSALSAVSWDELDVRVTNRIDRFRATLLRPIDLDAFEDEADNDEFGSALTVGDFNADGFDDAAIGIPSEDLGAAVDFGQVLISFGSINGLNEGTFGQKIVVGAQLSQQGQDFGRALAAGDFNCDGFDDLAIGVPLYDGTSADTGRIYTFDGSPTGLVLSSLRQIDRDTGDLAGTATSGDMFGASLASGNFNGDGDPVSQLPCDDLAIGTPGLDVNSQDNAGGAFVLFGGSNSLETSFDNPGGRVWTQARSQINGQPEPNDRVGEAVAAFDFGGDFVDDLLIGAPFDEFAGQFGAVHLIPGAAGSEFMDQANSLFFSASTVTTPGLTYRGFGAALATGIDYTLSNQLRGLAIGAPLTSIPSALRFGVGGVLQHNSATQSFPTVIEPPTDQEDANFGQQMVYADTLNRGLAGELWISEPGFNNGQGRIRIQGRTLIGNASVPTTQSVATTQFDLGDLGVFQVPANGDRFGEVLARGNFNGYGGDELLIGIPFWEPAAFRAETDQGSIGPAFNTGAIVEISWDLEASDPDNLFSDSFESPPI